MKQFLVLVFLIINCALWGQGKPVRETFTNTPLSTALNTLENNYQVKIAFDPEETENHRVTVTVDQPTMLLALSHLFNGLPFAINEVKSDYFTIIPLAKNWLIQGEVLNENLGPLPYAKIRIVDAAKGAYSDENGRFSFTYRSDIAPEIEISSVGYKTVTTTLQELQNGPIQLELEVIPIDIVVVEYLTKGITLYNDVSYVTLRPKKIGNVPGTTNPDVFQMVQNIPGINSASSSISDLQIRGGTADQNQILWDGIQLYHPGHFSGMISSVNPNMIDRATVVRGVYDPAYGGKASGLINLNSAGYVPEKVHGGVSTDMISTDAYVTTPIGPKVGLILSARRSTVDYWNSPTYKKYSERVYQETEISNSGVYTVEPDFEDDDDIIPSQIEINNQFYFYDINGKVMYRPNWTNNISASFIHVANRLMYSSQEVNSGDMDYNEIASTNSGLSFNLNHYWSDVISTDFGLTHSSYLYEFVNELSEDSSAALFEKTDKFNGINHSTFYINNRYWINDHHQFNGGYQLINNGVEYSLTIQEEEDTLAEIGTVEGFNNVFHLNHRYQTHNWLSKVGFRASHQSSNGKFYFEPRIYQQYEVVKNLKLRASFGMNNQFISQVDEIEAVQLGLSNRIWVMANEEDFPVVKSTLGSTGIIYQHNDWIFELDGYYKVMSDIVNFSDNPLLSSGFLRGDATAIGLDVMVNRKWENFRTWLSYSLSNVTYEFENFYNNSFPAPYNQKHNLNWVNTLEWRQFTFSTSFKIASGKPYSPVTGVETFTYGDPGEEEYEYELIVDQPNSKTLPLFHQLDLSVNYSFPNHPSRWKGTLGASCFNVYNRTNVLSRIYELDVTEDINGDPVFETYAVDRYYLSFTPNLLLRIEF